MSKSNVEKQMDMAAKYQYLFIQKLTESNIPFTLVHDSIAVDDIEYLEKIEDINKQVCIELGIEL
jgi:hypothetical protein